MAMAGKAELQHYVVGWRAREAWHEQRRKVRFITSRSRRSRDRSERRPRANPGSLRGSPCSRSTGSLAGQYPSGLGARCSWRRKLGTEWRLGGQRAALGNVASRPSSCCRGRLRSLDGAASEYALSREPAGELERRSSTGPSPDRGASRAFGRPSKDHQPNGSGSEKQRKDRKDKLATQLCCAGGRSPGGHNRRRLYYYCEIFLGGRSGGVVGRGGLGTPPFLPSPGLLVRSGGSLGSPCQTSSLATIADLPDMRLSQFAASARTLPLHFAHVKQPGRPKRPVR